MCFLEGFEMECLLKQNIVLHRFGDFVKFSRVVMLKNSGFVKKL